MLSPDDAARVLVVDDDEGLARFVAEVLADAKYDAEVVKSGAEAVARLEAERFDLMVTDLRMPGMSGMDLIEWARRYDPSLGVVAMTAYGSIETAVQAIRRGAVDYVTKPFEPEVLLLAVERCLRERRLRDEVTRLRTEADRRYGFEAVVAESVVMREVVDLARRVADSPSTVLLTGPSGAGKEVLARALHQASRRRQRPFVAVNCAAIPEPLLESELFGHKRGAFTGAVADKPGLMQEAHGGTLFLDEVGDLPLVLQAKLLRVLQEREVRPVGALRGTPVDLRVLAATHRDLRAALAERTFREDLYYRLCVIELRIPRLADRPEDVLPLAERFLREANARLGKSIRELSGAARKALCAYGWPGNVRELQNVIERAANLSNGEVIAFDDLPKALHKPREESFLDQALALQMSVNELQRAYAVRVLAQCGGNKSRAAQRLGIDRATLYRWLDEAPEAPGEPDG